MEIPFEKIEGEVTMEQAKKAIALATQSLSTTGSASSEYDLLNRIVLDLEAGDITPKEACEQAAKITDSRQDYH